MEVTPLEKMSGRRGPAKKKQTDVANGLGSVARERASRALSGGVKISTRRSKRVKAGAEGKEGKALDGVDTQEGSMSKNSLKQRVEEDDKVYNKLGTGTAVAKPQEAPTKEQPVGRLDKDDVNGKDTDDKEGEDSNEEGEGKECGVAESTKVQDSNLEQFLAKVEEALQPIAVFALSKTAFPARQVSSSSTCFMFCYLS